MYRLEFLPIARQDMIEIVRYINKELNNPIAALNLADEMIKKADNLKEFPYMPGAISTSYSTQITRYLNTASKRH